jgi:hypothetical protein
VGVTSEWAAALAIKQRKRNDFAARIVSDHPKRFGFFAVIRFPDADGSLKELDYAYDKLKADGVGILSSIGDKWPGHAIFEPAWREMKRRKALTFVHPCVPKCCRDLIPYGEHPWSAILTRCGR